jgi:hypothetical protein
MKRDLANPLAPTFPEKPKRKVKTVTPTKSGGTKKVVSKTKKGRFGTQKVEKTVERDASGKVVYKKKVKSPKGNQLGVEKTRSVTPKGKVLKTDKVSDDKKLQGSKKVREGKLLKVKTKRKYGDTTVKTKTKLTKDFKKKTVKVTKKKGEGRKRTVKYRNI